ncbi:MAG: STAS domain-containing protein [Thainema sp.]
MHQDDALSSLVLSLLTGITIDVRSQDMPVFLLLVILLLNDWIAQVPMAALVAVMIMVSISTFNWASIRNVRIVPKSETAVMVTTVVVTIVTHNLAIGVIIGVALSAIFFSRKIAALISVGSKLSGDETARTYFVNGQIFFVSVENFINSFDCREKLEQVTIDLTHAHLWDQSAVDAVDKVVLRIRKRGVAVDLIGLNEASATLLDRLAIHHKPDALDNVGMH